MFAWQALVTAVTFLTATQIQGLLVLNYESYVFARWHGTLLMWAFIVRVPIHTIPDTFSLIVP